MYKRQLQPILGHYRNQILVDEATDFSPIQLASMAALAHPRLRSFFACGDFNQRLTTWGARSANNLKWVFADFDIKEITVSYRQSKQLNDLARAMIRAVGGTEQDVSLPAHMDSLGVAPALLEHAADAEIIVGWLADRIREIERFVGQLPSTAIFVNTEDDEMCIRDRAKSFTTTPRSSVCWIWCAVAARGKPSLFRMPAACSTRKRLMDARCWFTPICLARPSAQ